MPKIAILAPRYGLIERGVETFTQDLINYLGKEFDFDVRSRKNTWCFPYWHQEFEMLTFAIGTLPYLLFSKIDLIFCQSGFWGMAISRLVRKIKGVRVIYRSAGGREPWIVRMKPDVYIATTPQIEAWIKGFAPQQKTVLIPNGVDTKLFSSTGSKVKLNLPRPVILCVAADIPAKRIDLAKKAVTKLGKGSLLIIGSKSLQVPHHEMPKYYRAGDVFTLPSWEEPFGIVYLEALACGLAVVAPNDSTRRYILGKGGVYCDVTNTAEYARALKKACGIKVAMGIQKKFEWKRVAKRYREVFYSII